MSVIYTLLSFSEFSVTVTTLGGPSCEGVLVRAPVVPIEIGYKITQEGAWLPIGIRFVQPGKDD